MHLIESYASSSRLKIDRPDIRTDFYPLSTQRFITVQTGGGMPAKVYDFFNEVFSLLFPYLREAKIDVVQLGSKGEPPVIGASFLDTSLHQAAYIIFNSLLHVGIDSCFVHFASGFDIPIVSLYSVSPPSICGPYWGDKNKQICIEPNFRPGWKYSFNPNESPKWINTIPPETVARSVLNLLNIPHTISQRTLLVNPLYNATMLDWVPDMVVVPQFNPEMPLNARMDLHHDDQVLANTLQTGRKVNLVTKKPINLNVLAAFKQLILSYSHEIDEDTPLDYVRAVKKTLSNITFFTRDPDPTRLANLRFKFFDVINIQLIPNKTREDFEKESAAYQNRPADEVKKELDLALKDGRLRFKTNKFVLSNGKMYLSLAHSKSDLPMEGENRDGVVIDDPEMWRDVNHFLIYS